MIGIDDEMVLQIILIIVVLIIAAPVIASAIAQLIEWLVRNHQYLYESAIRVCNIEDEITNQIVSVVEKNPGNNEQIQQIIYTYRVTGEISKCDIKQLTDLLDSDQRKRLNLPETVCTALNCLS